MIQPTQRRRLAVAALAAALVPAALAACSDRERGDGTPAFSTTCLLYTSDAADE